MRRRFSEDAAGATGGADEVGDEQFEGLIVAHGAGAVVTVVLDGEVGVEDAPEGGVGGGLVVASGLVGSAAGDEGMGTEGLANVVLAAAAVEQFAGDGDHADLAGDHVEDALRGFTGVAEGGEGLDGLGGATFSNGVDELEDVGFVVDGGEGFDDGFIDGGVAGVDLDFLEFGGERPEVVTDAGDEQALGAGSEVEAEGAGAVVQPGIDVAGAEREKIRGLDRLGRSFGGWGCGPWFCRR